MIGKHVFRFVLGCWWLFCFIMFVGTVGVPVVQQLDVVFSAIGSLAVGRVMLAVGEAP